MNSAICAPNCAGSRVCFSWLADETEIETSFCAAIRIAKEQKSVFLEKRASNLRRIAGKKLGAREDVDSDYLSDNQL
jgi:hypothetical protein